MIDNNIIDESGDHRYFAMMPNLVDDLGLSVYAYRLYGHLKRVTGETGQCWQSARVLAKSCRMSVHAVANAKKELLKHRLITIDCKKTPGGGKDYHLISVRDVWAQNVARYTSSPQEQQGTGSTLQGTHSTSQGTHTRLKKNSLRKTHEEEAAEAAAPSTPAKKTFAGVKRSTTAILNHPTMKYIKEIWGVYPPRDIREYLIEQIPNPDPAILWDIHRFLVAKNYKRNDYIHICQKYKEGGLYLVHQVDKAFIEGMHNPYREQP